MFVLSDVDGGSKSVTINVGKCDESEVVGHFDTVKRVRVGVHYLLVVFAADDMALPWESLLLSMLMLFDIGSDDRYWFT